MDADNTRRRFLLSSALGLSSAWLALRWPAIVAAQQHAQRSGKSGQSASFEFFAPQDALEIEAVAAQIIPSDDAPGAREARVIYFIDRALMTFDVDKQLAYTQGLEDLQQKTLELFPVADGFSSRSSAQQIQLLTGIEHSGFFELVRLHTIIYNLTDEIKKAMTGLLSPVFKETYRGKAEVRDTFRVTKVGMVAGCVVQAYRLAHAGQADGRAHQVAREHRPRGLIGAWIREPLGHAAGVRGVGGSQRVTAKSSANEKQLLPPFADADGAAHGNAVLGERRVRGTERGAHAVVVVIGQADSRDPARRDGGDGRERHRRRLR